MDKSCKNSGENPQKPTEPPVERPKHIDPEAGASKDVQGRPQEAKYQPPHKRLHNKWADFDADKRGQGAAANLNYLPPILPSVRRSEPKRHSRWGFNKSGSSFQNVKTSDMDKVGSWRKPSNTAAGSKADPPTADGSGVNRKDEDPHKM